MSTIFISLPLHYYRPTTTLTTMSGYIMWHCSSYLWCRGFNYFYC